MKTAKKVHQALATITLLLTLILTISDLHIQQSNAEETHYATAQNLSFQPENLAIEKGNTVAWINNDPLIHTLWFVFEINQSTHLLSPPIRPSQSWSHRFDHPAKIKYFSFERLWIAGRLRIVKVHGDVNWDGTVNIHDLHILGKAYQTTPGEPSWNEDADINFNNVVDAPDLTMLSSNYGKIDP